MTEYSFQMRCPSCGALNRLRLPAGKRLRVRCGKCGESLPLTRRRMFFLALLQQVKIFFARGLPLALLAVVELLVKVFNLFASPVRYAWRRVSPRTQRRVAWSFMGLCLVGYFLLEGSVRFGMVLLLVGIMAAAGLVMLLAVRGPDAVARMLKGLYSGGGLLRTCKDCRHRYFGWLKRCPKCGG